MSIFEFSQGMIDEIVESAPEHIKMYGDIDVESYRHGVRDTLAIAINLAIKLQKQEREEREKE